MSRMSKHEHRQQTPGSTAGRFAVLAGLLGGKGTGAPSPPRRRLAVVSLAASLVALAAVAVVAPSAALAAAPETPELKVEHVWASTAVFQGTLSPGTPSDMPAQYSSTKWAGSRKRSRFTLKEAQKSSCPHSGLAELMNLGCRSKTGPQGWSCSPVVSSA